MTFSSNDFNSILEHNHAPAIVTRPQEGEVSVQPSSVDLHLGDEYGWYDEQERPVSVWKKETYPDFVKTKNETEILIRPKEFLLAHTDDVVHLPNDAVGFLHGRSSVGRLGLFVHNAGLIDAGFAGDLTLELFNATRNTIVLKPEMRICQMTVHPHENPPDVAYSRQIGSKYQGQRGPTPSRLYEDFQ